MTSRNQCDLENLQADHISELIKERVGLGMRGPFDSRWEELNRLTAVEKGNLLDLIRANRVLGAVGETQSGLQHAAAELIACLEDMFGPLRDRRPEQAEWQSLRARVDSLIDRLRPYADHARS